MKLVLVAVALTLGACLPGCVSCDCPRQPAMTNTALSSGVRGIVRTADGRPVRARVAVVTSSGSVSTGTLEDGSFELTDGVERECVVYATTDEQFCAMVGGVQPGASGLELIVGQGGAIIVHSNQSKDVRCALFQGSTRFEDFTLRTGKPARVVVPCGTIRVQLYTPTDTVAEREVQIESGPAHDIDLSTHQRP